ncbi:MAG: hypothetical protein K0U84_20400 [Actinomycetia bacterium]|nr:hypothetical protein [Actinomycetes bacterium]
MSTIDDELDALMAKHGVAYSFTPQVSERADGTWEARYPAADWSVTADTRESALAKLGDSLLERRGSDSEVDWQLAAVRRHLAEGPVPGVYAIPLEVNERIMNSADPQAALDEVLKQIDAGQAARR